MDHRLSDMYTPVPDPLKCFDANNRGSAGQQEINSSLCIQTCSWPAELSENEVNVRK